MKTADEINKEIDRACDSESIDGDKYPGMSYTEGVKDALSWVMEYEEDSPFSPSTQDEKEE